MESIFNKKQNLVERLKFVRFYSLFENSRNFSLDAKKYLKSIKR
jgi:hypothetical protein